MMMERADALGMDDKVEDDDQLMLRLAQGHESALQLLMERHMGRVLRLAEGVVRNRAEADDIAQEAFLRAWRNAAGFDPCRARLSTWLNRIVINLSIDHVRKAGNSSARMEPIDEHRQIPATGASALARLLAEEEERAVANALTSLNERQRAAITLFHLEGLSARDCAEAMGLSGKAFESLLQRARQTLKRILAEGEESGEAP